MIKEPLPSMSLWKGSVKVSNADLCVLEQLWDAM
jgi:hypothetical protein